MANAFANCDDVAKSDVAIFFPAISTGGLYLKHGFSLILIWPQHSAAKKIRKAPCGPGHNALTVGARKHDQGDRPMNKDRRKRLEKISDALSELRDEIESLKDEEQEAFDALPESFQLGDQGNAMEEAISAMDDAECGFEDIIEFLSTARE